MAELSDDMRPPQARAYTHPYSEGISTKATRQHCTDAHGMSPNAQTVSAVNAKDLLASCHSRGLPPLSRNGERRESANRYSAAASAGASSAGASSAGASCAGAAFASSAAAFAASILSCFSCSRSLAFSPGTAFCGLLPAFQS